MAKKSKVTIKSVDHGYDKTVKTLKKLGKPTGVAIGILAKDANRKSSSGETTLLKVGTWNELGTDTIPARSFIRETFDMHRDEGMRRLTGLMRQVARGELDEEVALNRFGLWFQGVVQARMAESIPPPNAPSTIKKKGSDTTLIDHGLLRSAISYEIRRH